MNVEAPIRSGSIARLNLRVLGVVQGVGFRPYVYNLARRHGLTGFVLNSPSGVVLEIEGEQPALDEFLAALPAQAPPLVQISDVIRSAMAAQGDGEFVIRASGEGEGAFTLVPPDICVCEECRAEVCDPADRRYEYPFTNCTNCGPRYSIIEDIPYDRKMTTMADFTMCDACRIESEDPSNRRFHAQPNACSVCGPRISLTGMGERNAGFGEIRRETPGETPGETLGTKARAVLEAAADILLGGRIAAWKGLGGYQLACDARQQTAVEELRRRKRRNEKPFAVMVADAAAAERICFVSEAERAALQSRQRPIVLLRRRPDAGLAEAVSPANAKTGVMLPCTPMHDLLFRVLREKDGGDVVLVMTSGNVSEEPIVIDEAEAEKQLGKIADVFVHHNRRIHTRVDDSVVQVSDGEAMVLRRARGYAPQPIWLGLGDAEVLASGAQQKSTLCLTRAGFALPSQHLGDLENYETLRFYEETLERMRRLFHVDPKVVVHDLHPGYLSTQLALKMQVERHIGVQHHHAHIASCMAEHHLEGKVIGVAWDGTGMGTDGTIWGGEFLAADLAEFHRFAHLRTVLLAGGDVAVREPWRLALAYLRDAFDTAIPEGVRCLESLSRQKVHLVNAMLERRIHTIETSSCGRLFDAVASMAGLRQNVSFEGQAAMELEAIAADGVVECYGFTIDENGPAEVDMRPMVRRIVEDLDRGKPAARIAAHFHNTLIAVIAEVCRRMRDHLGLTRVCLSGGCFQNMRLLRGSVNALRGDGFEVFFQLQIPANDGGISLGQAAIACELIRRGA
jgi:hydrogenase maturation protein HypF